MTTWQSDVALTTEQAIEALTTGELEVKGRLVEASNATLYCELRLPFDAGVEGSLVHVVYKPVLGERPLDDFPDGSLAGREVAAWHLSELGGWHLVPPTVMRDGPFGMGMVQLWIEPDEDIDVLLAVLSRDQRLRAMALFDVVANNADRKATHLLPTMDGRFLGCDHGICFAVEPKLRTVLWGWSGEALLQDERVLLGGLLDALAGADGEAVREWLAAGEAEALADRIAATIERDSLPRPPADRRSIPWPPF